MERLTQEADFGLEDWEETIFLVKSDPNGAYNILGIASHVGTQEFDEILINIALRLAEIENILGDDYNYGLLSELVTAFKEGRYIIMRDAESEGVARLLELSEADRDGRCVLLPCKIGDTVYVVGSRKVVEVEVQEIYLDDMQEIICLVSFECDNCCDGCPFNSWSQHWEGEWECGGEYGDGSVKQSDFGKTVFLTREAAEAALKGDCNEN